MELISTLLEVDRWKGVGEVVRPRGEEMPSMFEPEAMAADGVQKPDFVADFLDAMTRG